MTTVYSIDRELLRAINQYPWTGIKLADNHKHDLFRLVKIGYLQAWGKDWDTAIISLTPKGRDYLKTLLEENEEAATTPE